MLASIAHDATKQREYALDAHFFVMKMWEQSYQTMNATLFYEQNRPQLEQMGYTGDNINEYMQEIMSSPDTIIPMQFTLPEKPDDWVSFALPPEFTAKC